MKKRKVERKEIWKLSRSVIFFFIFPKGRIKQKIRYFCFDYFGTFFQYYSVFHISFFALFLHLRPMVHISPLSFFLSPLFPSLSISSYLFSFLPLPSLISSSLSFICDFLLCFLYLSSYWPSTILLSSLTVTSSLSIKFSLAPPTLLSPSSFPLLSLFFPSLSHSLSSSFHFLYFHLPCSSLHSAIVFPLYNFFSFLSSILFFLHPLSSLLFFSYFFSTF